MSRTVHEQIKNTAELPSPTGVALRILHLATEPHTRQFARVSNFSGSLDYVLPYTTIRRNTLARTKRIAIQSEDAGQTEPEPRRETVYARA